MGWRFAEFRVFRKITGEIKHQMPRGRMNLINKSSVRIVPAQSGFTGEWL